MYFFSKYDQIRWKLRIWSYLLKKSMMENFIFGTLFEAKFLIVSLEFQVAWKWNLVRFLCKLW